MHKIAIGYGALLILIGLGGYAASSGASATALIPAGIGALVVVFGVLARQEARRMHMMHGAVTLGLISFLATASSLLKLAQGETALRYQSQAAVAVLSAVFVALCVKSFIDARRRRQAGEKGA